MSYRNSGNTSGGLLRRQNREDRERKLVKERIVALADAVKRTCESKRFCDIADVQQLDQLERIEKELRGIA